MKLTTNYIVYLNELNKVQCAKCRITGRFVNRAVAQLEYEKEYLFFDFSILAMLVVLFTMYLSNVLHKLENMLIKITLGFDEVLSHLSNDQEVKSIQYFCADSLLYKKKGNKE